MSTLSTGIISDGRGLHTEFAEKQTNEINLMKFTNTKVAMIDKIPGCIYIY